nr:hypothetical protein CFP56_19740 [Quercus suber]
MCWKEEEIDRLFIPEEAATIKAIPLSLFNRDDLPFWPYTRDGIFSVRLGYRLLLEQEETKVAGTNSLPTRANLVRRHVLDDALCQECKLHSEDVMHALWSCPNLNDVWRVHFEKLKADTVQISSFLEIIDSASLEKTSFDLFAITISVIWMCRNKVRVGETALPLR